MKSIRILSPNLDLLGEIDDYKSFILTLKYSKLGEFQLTISLGKANVDKLQVDNLLLLGKETSKVCIIKHLNIDQKNGKESLVVKGYTLGGIFKQRITIPPTGLDYHQLEGSAETLMKTYIDINCINPSDIKRKFPLLVNQTDLARGQTMPWQTRYVELLNDIEGLAQAANIGWRVSINTQDNNWSFDVYEGKNLTAEQEVNSPVIFSPQFDNIKKQIYMDSAMGYSNMAYVGGTGEGKNRRIVEVGNAEGLARCETFVNSSDVGSGITTDEELVKRLSANGSQALLDLSKLETFQCEILSNGPFIYGTDWDLGDIITIQNKDWGVTMNSRITEVVETYESDGFKLSATFGNSIPTLIDKIKNQTKLTSKESRK